MHALVTGSTGFVGRYLVPHLTACGDRVLGVARRAGAAAHTNTLAWSIDQPASHSLRAEIAAFAPTHLFHLAAIAEPRRCGSSEPTAEAIQTNVAGTRHVLELASLLTPRPRVILASSSHVYSPVTRESPVVDETWPTAPQSAYGQTKLAAERLALEMAHERGLEVVIARSFSQAGPGQEPRYLLAELAAQLAGRDGADPTAIRIQTRHAWLDLGDVRDAVVGYRLLAERGRPGQVYNLGTGVNRSSGEVLAELLAVAGQPDLPVVELAPDADRVRQSAVANIAKITADTGWRPIRPLRETAADTLAACRAAAAALR